MQPAGKFSLTNSQKETMAKVHVTTTEIPIAAIRYERERSVHLELSQDEADTLFHILQRIVGHAQDSRCKHADAISEALDTCSAVFCPTPDNPLGQDPIRSTGCIHFIN